jgi:flagellar hook-associated protein 3 FlgL
MIRITTNSVLETYKSNLNTSNNALTEARDTVLSQRNFSSFSEDPAAATQSFKLRRAWHRVDAQYTVSSGVTRKFDTAWSTLETVSQMVDTTASNSALSAVLRGNNDATGSGRTALGAELTQLADSVVQSMNNKYGDDYIFAGADGLNVPFTWDDSGNLCYRGVRVSALDDNGNEDTDASNTLKTLSEEASYVDIGLGIQTDDNGDVISSSAFNQALAGINYLGYGTSDGEPNNIAEILKKMGNILSNCDETSGEWASEADEEEYQKLMTKLEDASGNMKSALVELDTKASFLESNNSNLETTADTLNEQFLEIEQCDLADAITSFSWAQYCYNAALKVGNSILSQSLIDYMS